jgi:hypothetical protein
MLVVIDDGAVESGELALAAEDLMMEAWAFGEEDRRGRIPEAARFAASQSVSFFQSLYGTRLIGASALQAIGETQQLLLLRRRKAPSPIDDGFFGGHTA